MTGMNRIDEALADDRNGGTAAEYYGDPSEYPDCPMPDWLKRRLGLPPDERLIDEAAAAMRAAATPSSSTLPAELPPVMADRRRRVRRAGGRRRLGQGGRGVGHPDRGGGRVTSLNLGRSPTATRPAGGEIEPPDDGSRPAPPASEEVVAPQAESPGGGPSASDPASSGDDSPRLPETVSPAPPEPELPPSTSTIGVLRSAWARWWPRRYVRRGVAGGAVVVAATLVGLVTIDLGPAVRARAEQALGGYLDRDVSIGRVGIFVATGEFVVENLTIGG